MSYENAYRYIKAYDVLAQSNNAEIIVPVQSNKIQQLGLYKLSSLSKLAPEQQKQVIENAPPNEMIISHV